MTVHFRPVSTHQSRRRIERDLVKLDSDAVTKEEKGRRIDARHRRANRLNGNDNSHSTMITLSRIHLQTNSGKKTTTRMISPTTNIQTNRYEIQLRAPGASNDHRLDNDSSIPSTMTTCTTILM